MGGLYIALARWVDCLVPWPGRRDGRDGRRVRPRAVGLPAVLALAFTTACSGSQGAVGRVAVADAAGEERWYVVELLGERVGYAYEQALTTTWEGQPARRLRSEMATRMTRSTGGKVETLESRARVDWYESEAGEVLAIASEIGQPGNLVATSGRRVADRLELEITTSEGRRREQLPWDAGIASPSAAEAALGRLLEEGVGAATELRVFGPESGNAILRVRVRVVGHETLADGSRGTLVEQELLGPGTGSGMVTHELRDAAGELVRQEIGPMRMVRASREEATRPIAASLDAFRGLTARLHGAPRNPRTVSVGRYRLRLREEGGEAARARAAPALGDLFRLDGRQRLAGEVLVVDAAGATADPPTAAHLAPSSLIESDDPAIVAAASSALAGLPSADAAADAPARARRLERWVHEHVRFRGSGLGMATAKQTLDSRDGDCTEHAALLAALLRAAGIPSRLVVGLVAVDAGGDMMPHAWVEAWTGASWLPLDAALYGAGGVDATHLAMAVSDGGDTGALLDLAAPLARGLGRFDLEWVAEAPGAG
jgi:transglutaminase-like putative cysteine protease